MEALIDGSINEPSDGGRDFIGGTLEFTYAALYSRRLECNTDVGYCWPYGEEHNSNREDQDGGAENAMLLNMALFKFP